MANDDFAARLKTFAFILKYGHDLFALKNFAETAAAGINNAAGVLQFRSSALIRISGKKFSVAAVSGAVNRQGGSRYDEELCAFARQLVFEKEEHLLITAASGIESSLLEEKRTFLVLKLDLPEKDTGCGNTFLWLLEYEHEVLPGMINTAKLLGASLAEALAFQLAGTMRPQRRFAGGVFWCIAAGVLLAALLLIPVPENAAAQFALAAENITSGYAPFEGSVEKCLVQDGVPVKKNDPVLILDRSMLLYKLENARANLREIEAELALARQNAFTDQNKLAQADILEIRCSIARVAVSEAEHQLRQTTISAPADGVLSLQGGRAEQLAGKSVRTGEKLFEIFSSGNMVAEIEVNERDASILQELQAVSLYLHTAPEKAIPAEIVEIARYPELTAQRTFCYKVRCRILSDVRELRYGMRGVARLSGRRTALGYMLFKSLILGIRGL